MIQKNCLLTVDFNKSIQYRPMEFVKGDNDSCKFTFNIIQDITDLRVVVNFKLSDGSAYILDCANEDVHTASLVLPSGVFSVLGKVDCQVAIYGDSKRLTNAIGFYYTVLGDLSNGAIEADDRVPLLAQLLNDVGTLEAEVEASEAIRDSAENTRNSDEDARKTAEAERVSSFTQISAEYEAATHENTDIEIVNARGAYTNLGNRLTASDGLISNKTNKTYVDTLAASIASGSPKGVYATVTDLNTAHPTGDSGIYVINADGHWYYWNGSAWTDGGVYQSSGIADGSVTPLKTSFFKIGKNKFDKSKVVSGYYVNPNTGAIAANASYSASDYIKIVAGEKYTENRSYYLAFYDASKTYISGLSNGSVTTDPRTITAPANAVYIRVSVLNTQINIFQLEPGESVTDYEGYIEYIDLASIVKENTISNNMFEDMAVSPSKTNFIINGKNLFDKSNAVSGHYVHPSTGVLTVNTDYTASDYIKVDSSSEYTENGSYYLAFYNANKTFISGITNGSNIYLPRTITTPAECEYIRLSVRSHKVSSFQFESGSESTSFEAYGYRLVNQLQDEEINMVLHSTIPAVVGKEINIYFDNLVDDKLEKYNIVVDSDIGKQQNERWNCVPTSAGSFPLTLYFYQGNKLRGMSTANIVVKAASVGSGITKKALFIGDSTTRAGYITQGLLDLFGPDVMNLTLLGTLGTAPNLNEGRGGWDTEAYTTKASYGEYTNAFWNPGTSTFDFAYYMTAQSYTGVDYVVINLGINDTIYYYDDDTLQTQIDAVLARYQTMIDSIHAYNSTIKIGIAVTIPPCYTQDGFGASYGNEISRDRYKRNNNLFVNALIDEFKNLESSNVYLVPININIDTINNFPTETVAVNSRNTKTITRQSNGVHPDSSGYYQLSDIFYYWLKGFES